MMRPGWNGIPRGLDLREISFGNSEGLKIPRAMSICPFGFGERRRGHEFRAVRRWIRLECRHIGRFHQREAIFVLGKLAEKIVVGGGF